MRTDKILIKNLHIRAILGVLERERIEPQDVIVSITACTAPRPTSTQDDITGCVDYAELANAIRALVEGARRFTVEALADDIASLCLSRPGVRKVTVRVEKPAAVPEAESVGVEIERGAD
jgi:FolB domain-containing protein